MRLATTPDEPVHGAATLARALARAVARDAAHAGDLRPDEAAALLRAGAIVLVDVRTEPEWIFVGHVPGSLRIEWPESGSHGAAADFVARLAGFAQADGRPVALLCRSGVRSDRAAQAAAAVGIEAYNVLEGFEGHLDANGQRGNVNGWRHAGLPSTQGRAAAAAAGAAVA